MSWALGDTRPKRRGWAPGAYMGRCTRCGVEYTGDKRAIECADCAYRYAGLPRFIALCGNPGSGKSLVAEILQTRYGVQPVDDGWPVRDFAIRHLGMTETQVTTQDGKRETVQIAGAEWQVRKALGEAANALERTFGAHAMPWMAVLRCERSGREGPFSFASVRRDQGRFYKARGGVVVEIANPLAKPTGHEFDEYDRTCVDYTIENDALAHGCDPAIARADLEMKVDELVEVMLLRAAAA
ncbi:hypothetical protein [Salinarimonas rosea]|uniref:hypothetical protein n=1 Tax=Salinarimonas rosea TaxID=552063 RepID=UPI0004920423|nr:hypothetical protein [Salinarimonas rosea]